MFFFIILGFTKSGHKENSGISIQVSGGEFQYFMALKNLLIINISYLKFLPIF